MSTPVSHTLSPEPKRRKGDLKVISLQLFGLSPELRRAGSDSDGQGDVITPAQKAWKWPSQEASSTQTSRTHTHKSRRPLLKSRSPNQCLSSRTVVNRETGTSSAWRGPPGCSGEYQGQARCGLGLRDPSEWDSVCPEKGKRHLLQALGSGLGTQQYLVDCPLPGLVNLRENELPDTRHKSSPRTSCSAIIRGSSQSCFLNPNPGLGMQVANKPELCHGPDAE
ncbi:hypothetical protein TREES_T100019747 [Tupaia chinensis]|uniref:Uncharacterized protein n=1 Tax=Tupaia chinensis TaxID=246437 RepID=L9JDK2_TUPCH|nr:hypothetical protein TREES_T100019747 [Tupaia chinensis]